MAPMHTHTHLLQGSKKKKNSVTWETTESLLCLSSGLCDNNKEINCIHILMCMAG